MYGVETSYLNNDDNYVSSRAFDEWRGRILSAIAFIYDLRGARTEQFGQDAGCIAVYSVADILLYYTFLCLFHPSPWVFLKLETLPGFPVPSLVTKLNDSMQRVDAYRVAGSTSHVCGSFERMFQLAFVINLCNVMIRTWILPPPLGFFLSCYIFLLRALTCRSSIVSWLLVQTIIHVE